MPKNRTQLNVDMNELAFTNNPNTVLITLGVCTCIAFVIHGKYWDDEHEKPVDFCGLYHWSDFDVSRKNQALQTQRAFQYFLASIRDTFHLSHNLPIEIAKLQFIGGEKEQFDENEELILQGTEAEVLSLIKTVREFDFQKYHFLLHHDAIGHHHFLTQGDESLIIRATPYSYNVHLDPGTDEDNTSQSNLQSPSL
ncbi:MAG: hypothetical protein ACRCXC_05360 [Legionella sp.]